MKVNFHCPIEGKIRSGTVTKTKFDEYAISFVCEEEEPKPVFSGNKIGIDVGLKTFAVTSDGESFQKPNYLKKSETSLVCWQRKMARRHRGSSGYEKAGSRSQNCMKRLPINDGIINIKLTVSWLKNTAQSASKT